MRKLYLNKKGYLILICVLIVGLINAQERIYVKTAATGGVAFSSLNAHDSWASATSDLQAAINAVDDAGGGEVWVGSGVYKPTESYYTTDVEHPDYNATDDPLRSVSFLMRNGVSIIGGFNGEDNPDDRSNYDYGEDNATRLSGDIGVEGDVSDNAYHVVYGQDYTDNTAVLSDVIIVDGYANGTGRNSRGGGIQTRNGGTYNNLTIVDNTANRGAGAYAYRGGEFNNCLFWYNTAREYNGDDAVGGGIYLHLDGSRVENCLFNNNRSLDVGGAIGSSSGEIVGCTMINNSCSTKGGAIYTYFDNDNGNTSGGIYKNCLIANNTASVDGGGVFADAAGIWINCTIVNNQSESVAGGVYSETGASFTNVVIWGNYCIGSPTDEVHLTGGGTYTNCAIGNLTDLTVGTELVSLNLTNTEVDGPNFISPSTVKGRGETSTERTQNLEANWQHAIGSALTDLGTADITGLNLGDYDLADNDRVIQERIDIGAYELPYFRTTISSIGNGSVSETGPIDVDPGSNVSVDFTPDANHQIYTFTVNGDDRLADLVENTGVFTYTENNVQSNMDIAVEFVSLTAYDIDVTGDVGGDVSPEGTTSVYEGLDFSIELDPSNGYDLRSVLLDGEEQIDNVTDNGDGTYTFSITAVSSAHTIEVDFALIHTVTINLSAGGSASHSGTVEILEGNTIELVLTPENSYKLKSFLKASVETINDVTHEGDTYTYLISGITENLTIDVTFELFHNITVSANVGGTVSNIGVTELFESEDLTLYITPDIGYKFTQIQANGNDVMGDVTEDTGVYSYLVQGHTEDINIEIAFTKFEVVTISAGTGGTVSPLGDNELLAGEELTVVITPDAYYNISSVVMQGVDVTSGIVNNNDGSYNYVISNVTETSTLEVQFIHYNIVTIVAGPGGAVSHEGEYQIVDGESLEVTITPDNGNVVGGLTFDGEDRVSDIDDNDDGTYTYLIQGLTEDVVLDVQFTLATGF